MFSVIDQISILSALIVLLLVICALFLCLGDRAEQRRVEGLAKLAEEGKENKRKRELRGMLSWRDSMNIEGSERKIAAADRGRSTILKKRSGIKAHLIGSPHEGFMGDDSRN
ncbi:hypothetical protein GcC1_211031 [Golovinomyces cichoracearum]|uniref:Uncharacterized protein n=1 Tax=Golovinomyces cichoracearum TaxID=62708 RepID=A0A420HAP8_9PEZI|nr:hypothetical protein GcC1_211031 [Golovinomyces cichoracearum]